MRFLIPLADNLTLVARGLISAVALIASLSLAAATETQTYRGIYKAGFETSRFIPDGKEEHWWITAKDPEIGKRLFTLEKTLTPDQVKKVGRLATARLEAEGVVSELGQYGSLGAYQREFEVTKIISLTLIDPKTLEPLE